MTRNNSHRVRRRNGVPIWWQMTNRQINAQLPSQRGKRQAEIRWSDRPTSLGQQRSATANQCGVAVSKNSRYECSCTHECGACAGAATGHLPSESSRAPGNSRNRNGRLLDRDSLNSMLASFTRLHRIFDKNANTAISWAINNVKVTADDIHKN